MYKLYPQPIVQKTSDNHFRIVKDWKVQLSNGDMLYIRKSDNFVHDYTSIPKPLLIIFSKFSVGDMGAVAHDFMYTYKGYKNKKGELVTVSRKQADYEMAFIMRVYGDKSLRLTLFFIAVNIMGWIRWGKKERQVA